MGKIVLLDDLTINQIAAGEVIERPASVVKELVENSIDAGAKNIIVEIKNGGISYIRVSDDGSGIMPDDMEIAFERHATSKIRQAEDLNVVKSMGFRGEALASIAAIAKVELVSKTADSEIGYKVIAEGGDILDKHEEGAQKGTTITIRELFYNTPVRYKFLKKDFTESGYIEDTITRIALANPDVAIKLINTGKTIIQTNGNGKLEDCIYEIYGREVYDNLLPVDYTYENYHATGVIGKPIISRSNRTNQIFFINKRYVKDKTLTSAADQGFKGLVTIGKHGFLIINIDMDSSKVDVNVHPTKLEVRFQEESKMFKTVYHAIKETLLKSDLVSDPVKDYENDNPSDILKGLTNKQRTEAWNIGKSAKNVEKQEQNSSKIENQNNKPEFSEFKSTISGLDDVTRQKFIDEITKAKTPDEIKNGLGFFASLARGEKVEIPERKENENEEITQNKETTENKIELKTSSIQQNIKDNINSEEESNEEKEKEEESGVTEDTVVIPRIDITKHKIDEDDTKYDLNEELPPLEKLDESKIEFKGMIKPEEEAPQEMKKETKAEDANETAEEIKEDDALQEKVEEGKHDEPKQQKNENEESNEKQEEEPKRLSPKLTFEEMYRKMFGRDIETAQKEYNEKQKELDDDTTITPIEDNEISIFDDEGVDKNRKYKFLGIAFKTYILLTKDDTLYMMDQHAAHERILFERVKENYYSDSNKDSQLMLLPDVVELSNREMGIFKDNKEMFERAGFVVEEFGETTVKITGVPEFCLDFDNKEIFLEILDQIDTVARTAKQELENKFLATVACKAAVKANMTLSEEEVYSLIDQLFKLPNPFSCPHGRPTIIKMTKTDIEKKFSRRM